MTPAAAAGSFRPARHARARRDRARDRLDVRSERARRHRRSSCTGPAIAYRASQRSCVVAVTPDSLAAGFTLALRVASRSDAGSAPATNIRSRVPIVTGSTAASSSRLPWKSARFEVKRITRRTTKDSSGSAPPMVLRRYDGVRFITGAWRGSRSTFFRIHHFRVDDERPRRHDLVRRRVSVEQIRSRHRQHHAIPHQRGHACGSLGHAIHITQDHEDRMWIATDAGLRRLDPATSQVTCYRVSADDGSPNAARLGSSPPSSRAAVDSGSPGDAGLDLLDPRSGQVTTAFRARNSVRARAFAPAHFRRRSSEDRSGIVWVGLSSGARSGVSRPGNRHRNRVRVRPTRAAERIIRRAVDPRG